MSHEHRGDSGSESEKEKPLHKECPATMAAFDHRTSYGEKAHMFDQPDGFRE